MERSMSMRKTEVVITGMHILKTEVSSFKGLVEKAFEAGLIQGDTDLDGNLNYYAGVRSKDCKIHTCIDVWFTPEEQRVALKKGNGILITKNLDWEKKIKEVC